MTGKLNCRPGDLAFIVSADSVVGRRHIGKIVLVLKKAALGRYRDELFETVGRSDWFIDFCSGAALVPLLDGGTRLAKTGIIRDENLRPIRDQPGDDEALTWTGLPGKVEVLA